MGAMACSTRQALEWKFPIRFLLFVWKVNVFWSAFSVKKFNVPRRRCVHKIFRRQILLERKLYSCLVVAQHVASTTASGCRLLSRWSTRSTVLCRSAPIIQPTVDPKIWNLLMAHLPPNFDLTINQVNAFMTTLSRVDIAESFSVLKPT